MNQQGLAPPGLGGGERDGDRLAACQPKRFKRTYRPTGIRCRVVWERDHWSILQNPVPVRLAPQAHGRRLLRQLHGRDVECGGSIERVEGTSFVMTTGCHR
jgi:hypothetical protein